MSAEPMLHAAVRASRRRAVARMAAALAAALPLGRLLAQGKAPAAASGPALVEGRDFARIEPAQAGGARGKVEVIEFFSYACPHCKAFDPVLQPWADKLPADVAFRRVPIAGLYNAPNFMRTYYALESLGLLAKVHAQIFTAVHDQHQRLDKPEDIAAIVARNGGDPAKFLAAFNSFAVATAVARGSKTTADYRIDGVPMLAIGGLYTTSVDAAKQIDPDMSTAAAEARTLVIADALIERARHRGAH